MGLVELDRRSLTRDAVTPRGVMNISMSLKVSAHAPALEQLEESLCDRVVLEVFRPAHAADQIVLAQERL